MITGISTACFCGRYETEDSFEILKELGVRNCELFLRTFYEYRPDFAKKFAPRTEGIKAEAVSVLPFNFEPQLFLPSLRQRGDGYYWLEQLMRSMRLFGADKYVFRGLVCKDGKEYDYGYLSEMLNEVIGMCSGSGVSLCLENNRCGLYNRPSVFKQLKERCGGLSGVLNIEEARLSGYPYNKYIEDMEGSISLVRLSDIDKDGKVCLPGKGINNFAEILKRLKGAGFDRTVLIDTQNFGDLSELKQSLDFLNEIVYKIK